MTSFKRLKEQNGATLEDVVSTKSVHKKILFGVRNIFRAVLGKVNGLDRNLE